MSKIPLDWTGLKKEPFHKMLVDMSLRHDRMTAVLTNFICRTLPSGSSYIEYDFALNSIEILDQCISDSIVNTSIYFILNPGANDVVDQDMIAVKHSFHKGISYHFNHLE